MNSYYLSEKLLSPSMAGLTLIIIGLVCVIKFNETRKVYLRIWLKLFGYFLIISIITVFVTSFNSRTVLSLEELTIGILMFSALTSAVFSLIALVFSNK